MARTFPRTLLEEDLKSNAERKVFEALRDQLSDEWSVFHSASVIYRDHAEGARDDEGDFVLCHPERAIVCLEVKGGGIECQHGEWFRLPAGGPRASACPTRSRRRSTIATRCKRKIAERRGVGGPTSCSWSTRSRFPDITVHKLVLAPDAPPEILLDRNDLDRHRCGDSSASSPTTRARATSAPRPDPRARRCCAKLLAPTFRIEVPMATLFEEEERELVELTHEQAALLQPLRPRPADGRHRLRRLGQDDARGRARDASSPTPAAGCCSSASTGPLRKHLQESAKVDGLDFFTFHGLCTRAGASQAGIELPKYEGEAPPEFWSEVLPDALVEAIGDARRPVRRHPRRRGPGPAHRLARRR